MASSQELVELQGKLEGHQDWVTCIATAMNDTDTVLTGSRDGTVLLWQLKRTKIKNPQPTGPEYLRNVEGKAIRRLKGHSHFVSDIDISADKQYALSSSWDGSLRLWNLQKGEKHKLFKEHTKDVLSVAFSADNHCIVSGSMDKTIRVWNVIGKCQQVLEGHSDWVTCVRFSPNTEDPVIVSCGRDKLVKVWSMKDWRLKHNLVGHTSYVNSVTVSPDGSLCASGGKDGIAMLWDLNEGKTLSNLEAGAEIHALCFSPNRYWLCGAVGGHIKIWDLETKDEVGTLTVKKEEVEERQKVEAQEKGKKKKKQKGLPVICTSLAWAHDGKTLFAGYSDSTVRVWTLLTGDEYND